MRASPAADGSILPQVSRNIDQKPTLRDPKVVLETVSATNAPGDYLRGLHPKHVQFERLRQALVKARTGAGQPEEKAEAVVRLPDGPTLEAGHGRTRDVALLRQRLKVRTSPGTEAMFDDDVAEAVKAFQKKNGLRADGVLSKQTRTALNGAAGSAPGRRSARRRSA